MHDVPEITWAFTFKEGSAQDVINAFIESFVFDFVEPQGWYCGGGENAMGMYDIHGIASKDVLKPELIKYLKSQADIIDAVVMTRFDETLDDFVIEEEIRLSDI